MRWQTTTSAPCATYGLASHAGYLFERQRTAMRQNAFARARLATSKRKARDSDDSSGDDSGSGDDDALLPQPAKRAVLHGLKRMRVSSPPSSSSSSPTSSYVTSPPSTTTTTTTSNTSYFTSSAATRPSAYRSDAFSSGVKDDAAMDDDDDSREAEARAMVPLGQARSHGARRFSSVWPAGARTTAFVPGASDLQMPPSDASCTAIVLFDGANTSVPRGPSPRVELVESDDESGRSSPSDEDEDSDGKPFVRFELLESDDEAADDDGESMELD